MIQRDNALADKCTRSRGEFRSEVESDGTQRMQFERPRCTATGRKCQSVRALPGPLIYAPIRSPRPKNASLVKPRATDAQKVAEGGFPVEGTRNGEGMRGAAQQTSSDMNWDQ